MMSITTVDLTSKFPHFSKISIIKSSTIGDIFLNKKFGPTRTRTRVFGFEVRRAQHCTIRHLINVLHHYLNYRVIEKNTTSLRAVDPCPDCQSQVDALKNEFCSELPSPVVVSIIQGVSWKCLHNLNILQLSNQQPEGLVHA